MTVPSRTDPNWLAEAREHGVQALADVMQAEAPSNLWLPLKLVPRRVFERIARAQIDALSSLPAPTRRALLEKQ